MGKQGDDTLDGSIFPLNGILLSIVTVAFLYWK
jgi:hypothetical protein